MKLLHLERTEGWVYKAEGNANIVYGYQGSNKNLYGRIIRVRKKANESNKSGNKHGNVSPKKMTDVKDEHFAVRWSSDVMRFLLGSSVVTGKLYSVSEQFLTELSHSSLALRPVERVNEGTIDIESKMVVICRDASISFKSDPTRKSLYDNGADILFSQPNISNASISSNFYHFKFYCPSNSAIVCVEIKPKWGFIPKSGFISKENELKKRICRYCIQQASKASHKTQEQNHVLKNDKYCPMDLYSNDRNRMIKSLKALIRNPQNNLRIFVNGTVVFPGNQTDDNNIMGLQYLSQVLIDHYPQYVHVKQIPNSTQEFIENYILFVELIVGNLLKGNELCNIRKIQMLDQLDVEGIMELYLLYKDDDELKRLSQATDESNINTCISLEDVHTIDDLKSIPKEIAYQIFRNFLFSLSAKDCSIMTSVFKDESKDEGYKCETSIIDLDPRYIENIPYYYKQDQDLVKKFKESSDFLKPCNCEDVK